MAIINIIIVKPININRSPCSPDPNTIGNGPMKMIIPVETLPDPPMRKLKNIIKVPIKVKVTPRRIRLVGLSLTK